MSKKIIQIFSSKVNNNFLFLSQHVQNSAIFSSPQSPHKTSHTSYDVLENFPVEFQSTYKITLNKYVPKQVSIITPPLKSSLFTCLVMQILMMPELVLFYIFNDHISRSASSIIICSDINIPAINRTCYYYATCINIRN